MALKKAIIKQVQGTTLIARGNSNHWVTMDGGPNTSGSEAASTPKELLLFALGGCTAMDVIPILKKSVWRWRILKSTSREIRGRSIRKCSPICMSNTLSTARTSTRWMWNGQLNFQQQSTVRFLRCFPRQRRSLTHTSSSHQSAWFFRKRLVRTRFCAQQQTSEMPEGVSGFYFGFSREKILAL